MVSIISGTFKFFIKFTSDGFLPRFRGPTIRGAIGYHLKKTVCHSSKKNCEECLISQNCIYRIIFEGLPPDDRDILKKYPTIPQPFVLDVSPSDEQTVNTGDSYCFSIKMFGKEISHLPYLVYSIIEVGKSGLGKDRIPFELKKVIQILKSGEVKDLYNCDDSNMAKPETERLVWDNNSDNQFNGRLKIEFLTPTKYRNQGSLTLNTNFNILFKTILRRIKIMCHFYGDGLENSDSKEIFEYSKKIKTISDDTKLHKFTRISGRQKRRIQMGGIIGNAVYEGDFNNLMPFLKASEIIHIGKNTSFGFGKVKIQF